MPIRTNSTVVISLLEDNYNGSSSVEAYMTTASILVDRMVTCATAKGVSFSDDELEMIERWLACHYYLQMDPAYSSLSALGASGSYTGQTGKSLESTRYGQSALDLDYSGCLYTITTRQKARAFWAGTRERDRRSYDDRNN